MKVVASPLARASIRDAIAYYRTVNPRAAERFKQDLQACRRKLAAHPEIGTVTSEDGVRVVLSLRFRYLVYYEILADAVLLLDVQHASRQRPASGRP